MDLKGVLGMKDSSFIYFYFILRLLGPFIWGGDGGGDCLLLSMLLGMRSSQSNRNMIVNAQIFPDKSVNEPFMLNFAHDP